jgi:hypothetical protein
VGHAALGRPAAGQNGSDQDCFTNPGTLLASRHNWCFFMPPARRRCCRDRAGCQWQQKWHCSAGSGDKVQERLTRPLGTVNDNHDATFSNCIDSAMREDDTLRGAASGRWSCAQGRCRRGRAAIAAARRSGDTCRPGCSYVGGKGTRSLVPCVSAGHPHPCRGLTLIRVCAFRKVSIGVA